jgi:hypothetical protein
VPMHTCGLGLCCRSKERHPIKNQPSNIQTELPPMNV